MTQFGHVRHVFYSNIAAPLIEELIREAGTLVAHELRSLETDRDIEGLSRNEHIARRFQALLDLLPDLEEN